MTRKEHTVMTHEKKEHAYVLRRFKINCIIGVYDFERTREQELFFHIKARYEHKTALNLDDTVKKTISDYCSHHMPLLLERMAYELGLMLLKRVPACSFLSITIDKPYALEQAKCSYVQFIYKK